MTDNNEITLSHEQMKRMSQLTWGYRKKDWSFWVSAQRIVYLTVYNIVYNIDVDGGYIARRKSDGELVQGGSSVFAARTGD